MGQYIDVLSKMKDSLFIAWTGKMWYDVKIVRAFWAKKQSLIWTAP